MAGCVCVLKKQAALACLLTTSGEGNEHFYLRRIYHVDFPHAPALSFACAAQCPPFSSSLWTYSHGVAGLDRRENISYTWSSTASCMVVFKSLWTSRPCPCVAAASNKHISWGSFILKPTPSAAALLCGRQGGGGSHICVASLTGHHTGLKNLSPTGLHCMWANMPGMCWRRKQEKQHLSRHPCQLYPFRPSCLLCVGLLSLSTPCAGSALLCLAAFAHAKKKRTEQNRRAWRQHNIFA